MNRLALVLWIVLAGCGGPTPAFRDREPTRVIVSGSVFDVRVNRDMAEAIRVNGQYAPRLGRIGPRAVVAMQQVSGCRVTGLLGDAAVTLGVLDCSAQGRTGPRGVLAAIGPDGCPDWESRGPDDADPWLPEQDCELP